MESEMPQARSGSLRNSNANANQPPPGANTFNLSGVPNPPRTFEEQQLLEYARGNGRSWSEHEKLANYYEKKGDLARARAERKKADYWKNN